MGIICTFNQVQQKLLELIQYEDKLFFISEANSFFFKTLPIGRNNMCNKSKSFGMDRRREA